MFNKPLILSVDEVDYFRKTQPIKEEKDVYDIQCAELARIAKARGSDNPDRSRHPTAVYVYYPWSQVLLKTVSSDDLFALRTNRNKNLITEEEQTRLAKSTVGVAGMSVGSGIALGLIYSGISAECIKIADKDTLDTSNLNRLRESLINVGRPKVHLAAEHIYELDPFTDVHLFEDGLTPDNLADFFGNPKPGIVIDEIDDFKMKVQLRMQAKEHKVPLIMFTSLGDNILVDVERFDVEPKAPIFHGLLSDDGQAILDNSNIDTEAIRRYSVELVGQEYIPTRALKSVAEMGRSLVGRPQLYSTVAVDGGLAAYIVRRLLLDGDIKSGRYFIKFSKLVGLEPDDLEQGPERQKVLEKLFK